MKKWYWSKTIQLSALQFITGFVEAFFSEYPPEVGLVLMAKSLIDTCLRSVTTGGVTIGSVTTKGATK